MRIIDPSAESSTGGRTVTMTARLVALRPSAADVFDALFLVGLVMLAILGFATSFDSPRYLIVALAGVLLGVLAAHLANVLRWHWLSVIAMGAAAYLLLGGAIALRDDLILGVIPSVATLTGLSAITVNGWKELLTTLPPVAGDGPFVALPYLLAVIAGAGGFSIARRTRSIWPALMLPTGLLAGVTLLGTYQPAAGLPPVQGFGFAALAFGWLAVRWHRRRRLIGTGSTNLTRVILGAGVLAVAMAGSLVLGPALPGVSGSQRVVLRTYVQPPVQLPSLTSPLVGFRKYSGEGPKSYYDVDLLRVNGVAEKSLLRIAVLDDYSGTTWSATAGGSGAAFTGFQRLGSQIPARTVGEASAATITVQAGYASNADLAAWVPSLGQTVSLAFEGDQAKQHARQLRYNLSTGQGLVADSLDAGDSIQQRGVPLAVVANEPLAPGGTPVVSDASFAVLAPGLAKLTGSDGTAWEQLTRVMAGLKNGAYSDGTLPGEERFRPGHGLNRLRMFLSEDQLVGSDEQYAAVLGLAATQLGYPARVVFGAIVPAGGMVQGNDISAWVEIQAGDGSWVTIPPDSFIPSRDKHPEKIPPETSEDAAAVVVPPPNPVRPPGAFDSQFELDSRIFNTGNPTLAWILGILIGVLRWIGPPLLLILLVVGGITGAKALRRRRRRTRGAPTTRIAGGWREVVDLARDLGHAVPLVATRQEQTLAVGRADLVPVAQAADRAIFGVGDPSPEAAASYWASVETTRKAMITPLKGRHRWLARLSLRSLLPAKLVPQPKLPRWSPFGHRVARTDATMSRVPSRGDGL